MRTAGRNRHAMGWWVAAGVLVLAVAGGAGSSPGRAAAAPPTRESVEKTQPPAAESKAEAAPAAVDPIVARTKAVGDAIGAVLGAIGWAIVALVLLLVFQCQLREILKTLATAMQDRGVTLDVLSVKVQIAERALDASEERVVLFSGWPLEIVEEASLDRPGALGEIVPQRKFPVTDTVAQYWKATHAAETNKLSEARDRLEARCRGAHDFAGARSALVEFARALEVARFLDASILVDLLDRDPVLREGIRSLKPGDVPGAVDDYVILHAAGVAYAQRSRWASAIELLDKIAWKGETFSYVPAADTWLACAYHATLTALEQKHRDGDFEQVLPELSTEVKKLLTQGRGLASAMDSAETWRALPRLRANVGYYRREVLKSIGEIASILLDYAVAPEDKATYRQETEGALKRCCEEIAHEPPSPLDWNNLADVYRQQGRYAEAHETLDQAGPQLDPAFQNTRALIFHGENKPLQGLLALQRYGEAQASAASDQDLAQYVENQILAAKLAAAIEPRMSPPHLAQAADLLEAVRQFVDGSEKRRRAVEDEQRAEIDALLGFTYLQLPGRETAAVEAFARLAARGYGAGAAVRWRRRLGHARALTRLARSQRRAFSSEHGAQSRKDAAAVLTDSGNALKQFGLDTGVALARRDHHLRLHLDTAIAWQALAEETFSQGAWQTAREDRDQGGTILGGPETVLATDPAFLEWLGPARATIQRVSGSPRPAAVSCSVAS